MTNISFEQGFSALLKVFPNLNLDVNLFWNMLQDLDGEHFLRSVWEFIKNTKEVYPGTNIIATIRIRAEELQIKARANDTLKLEVETEKERIDRWQKESVPMPTDCKLALAKLGIKIGD